MSNSNKDLLALLSKKVFVEIDAGEYAARYKGQSFEVWVNAPGIGQELFGDRGRTVLETTGEDGQARRETRYDPLPPGSEMAQNRRVVRLLYLADDGTLLDPATLEQMDDRLVNWLSARGLDAYYAYHDALKND